MLQKSALSSGEARHLLRRLASAATPPLEAAIGPKSAAGALDTLLDAARRAPAPAPPACVRDAWSNTALRMPGMTDQQADARRAVQVAAHRRDIELIRQWWLGEMIEGAAPLRENLTLFFETTFGSSTELVDVPHAIHGRNALVRRLCLGTVPALLDALVVDPAMMIQIGMDEHFKARVSDRPAKLILDHWTVGAGAYTDSDVDNLSRALTGWRLAAAPGQEPAVRPDGNAVVGARRTGLTPAFVPDQFDSRAKTILGATGNFDARAAMAHLARHPATARRFSVRLLRHLGVETDDDRLPAELAATYQSSDGSIDALLRVIVTSEEFWSVRSRWALIKSPVQLAVGACRQLDLAAAPLAEISRWLSATGQTLFDTAAGAEGGWPGQEGWLTPPERLVVRYQLPVVLGGRTPLLGVRAPAANTPPAPVQLPLGAALGKASASTLIARLDPAPGLEAAALARTASPPLSSGSSGASEIVRRVMMTPQYQLA